MSRSDLNRVFRVLRLLPGNNATILSERLGVSYKTVQRDVDTLRDLGVPLLFNYQRNRWFIGQTARVPDWFPILQRAFAAAKKG